MPSRFLHVGLPRALLPAPRACRLPRLPRAWLLIVAFALHWAHPGAAPAAEDPCKGALIDRVQANYQAIQSFQGRFEQEDRQSDGRIARAAGRIAYLRPGRMRWEYEPPNEQLLVTDGETVWLYDPILDNVTVQPLAELTQGTPLAFLLGAGNLKADFSCRPYTRTPPDDGLTYLELVPRRPIPALDYIQLGMPPGYDHIASLRMVDSQGNVRTMRFLNLRTNVPLAPERFTFLVTPDMEVITKSSP